MALKVRGFDTDASKGQLLEQESTHHNLKGFSDVKLFVESLKKPQGYYDAGACR